MKDIQQLIKKNSQEGRYEDIFPKTFLDAVIDKESGTTLTDILSSFNMYFLSYTGSRETTRLEVPMSLRKQGLWITYVLYDGNTIIEWYGINAVDDVSWQDGNNWRLGSNMLVGDISISADGNWIINGVDSGIPARGEKGDSAMLRVNDSNRLQVSYTNGNVWIDLSDNPVYTQFRVNNNKLEQSIDLGKIWSVVSDYIAAWFRFTGTAGSSQADNVGKIQISRDNGATWSDLSGEFTNSLHIKGYVATVGALPSTAVQGDIYGVGPTYDSSDTEHTNPIYQLYVKDSTGWVNNGRFTSITAGVVQELGNSETAVISQKGVTTSIGSLKGELDVIQGYTITLNFRELSSQLIKNLNISKGEFFTVKVTSNITWRTAMITYDALDTGDNRLISSVSKDTLYKFKADRDINSLYFYLQDSSEFGDITIEISGTQYAIDKKYENSIDNLTNALFSNSISTTYKVGSYIEIETGSIYPNSAYKISDFIPVFEGQTLELSDIMGSISVAKVAAYDSDLQYIRASSISTSDSHLIYKVPNSISYIKVCTNNPETPTIMNSSIVTDNVKVVTSYNLFTNVNASKGVYLYSNGELFTNSNYNVTTYIDIEELTQYYISAKDNAAVGTSGAYICFYDANKAFLSSITSNTKSFVTPESSTYIRVSYQVALTEIQLVKGNQRKLYYKDTPITGYIEDLQLLNVNSLRTNMDQVFGVASKNVMTSNIKGIERLTMNSMNPNTILESNTFPQALKKGNSITLNAEFTSWDTGISLGYGYNNNLYGAYLTIDSTNIHIKSESAIFPEETIPHNLTITSFIRVSCVNQEGILHINIITLNGNFEYKFNNWGFDVRGVPFIYTTVQLSNVVLSLGNSSMNNPIWAFGDSYFRYIETRVMYWLHKWGYDNMCVQGFGGQSVVEALQDLRRMLAFKCPQYIVWAVGMNGNYDIWLSYFKSVEDICKEFNIELIAYTLPVVRSTNPYYAGKQAITDYVRSSGYRYIDTYKAVNSDSEGRWYNNDNINDYQSSDDVHPTKLGAIAIASQWLIDFPEILQ